MKSCAFTLRNSIIIRKSNFDSCRYFSLNNKFFKETNTAPSYSSETLRNQIYNKNRSEISLQMNANQNSLSSLKYLKKDNKELVNDKNYNEKSSLFLNIPLLSNKPTKFKGFLFSILRMIEELTHMDECRRAQEKVMKIKDELKEYGDLKRKILLEMSEIRDNIQKIHSDMRLVNRGTNQHIQLLDNELECLKKEQQKLVDFKYTDEIERNLFNNLTVAINESYEKEKIHTNTVRLWGYIQAVVATICAFLLSFFGLYYREGKNGLLIQKLEENVSNVIKSEIESFQHNMVKEIEDLKEVVFKSKEQNVTESWGAYFKRHSTNVYRYFWPKS